MHAEIPPALFLIALAPIAPVTAQAAVPCDMVHWWTGDLQGSSAPDLWGGVHGVARGNTTSSPGLVGAAFTLDGRGDDIDLGPSLANDMRGDLTIEFWVRLDSLPVPGVGNYDYAFANFDTSGQRAQAAVSFGATRPGGLGYYHSDRNGGPWSAYSVANVLIPGQWHHVAVVRDQESAPGSGGSVELFLDGAPLAGTQQTYQGEIALSTDVGPWSIGSSGAYGSDYVDGDLDELCVYDRALTHGEIAAIHGAGAAGRHRDLARAVARIGSGVNPTGFTAPAPVLGSTWNPQIPVTGSTVSVHVILSGTPARVPYLNREVLCRLPPSGVLSGTASISWPIPHESCFIGISACAQGLRIDRQAGGLILELFNAQDLVFGL